MTTLAIMIWGRPAAIVASRLRGAAAQRARVRHGAALGGIVHPVGSRVGIPAVTAWNSGSVAVKGLCRWLSSEFL
jgi:hypothetical protein